MKSILFFSFAIGLPYAVFSQQTTASGSVPDSLPANTILLVVLGILLLIAVAFISFSSSGIVEEARKKKRNLPDYKRIISGFSKEQIDRLLENPRFKDKMMKVVATLVVLFTFTPQTFAQAGKVDFSEGGIIITLILLAIPVITGIILVMARMKKLGKQIKTRRHFDEVAEISNYLDSIPDEQLAQELHKQKALLEVTPGTGVLSGDLPPADVKGVLKNINEEAGIRFVEEKKRATPRAKVDPDLSKLILWYIITATFWLIFGTTIGEYVGIKFVAPDADQVSWLSFGRLRPVHTNSVFWGWASLAMMGLGYYVVPRVGNNKLYNIKWGWWALYLVNASVLIGTILLMAGINNSGGEFREYIWPVQLLFGIAVVLSMINYIMTIARRKTKEIYVSNWYIVAATMFGTTIMLVAYLPFWQDGLGETISQGYYMHQGVGMWFMMFVLGLIYYFLPQQLNKPIYAYSLGILAFWTQILFYTLIGSHHFVFSSIPWWLQTVAIVGSVGMVIPVVAGTTNFIMTFNGSWHKLSGSYTLPFMLIGTIFYFTGSMQGTAEAFRSTNLYWHFTDFTVAHSHLTMYGIITFFLWGFIYALVPRITRREPPQVTVGIHFWLAFIGLMFYSVPLMIGGTLKGLSWMNGDPFMESVKMMAPYWLWRAIGGSLMWLSHLVFAYNVYKMIRPVSEVRLNEEIINRLEGGAPTTISTEGKI